MRPDYWLYTLLHAVLAYLVYRTALRALPPLGGAVVVFWLWIAVLVLVMNTIDLLFGRWIRRGRRTGGLMGPTLPGVLVYQVIVAQVHVHGDRTEGHHD
jgi:hypothetical protein